MTNEDILESLVALLPTVLVNVRLSAAGPYMPYVQSVAVGMLRHALNAGVLVDRSNGSGPIEEWDGWLVIDNPESQTFIQTERAKKVEALPPRNESRLVSSRKRLANL